MSKIYRLIACLICVLAITGCSLTGGSDSIKFPGEDKESFEQSIESWVGSISAMSDSEIEDSLSQMEGVEDYAPVVNALTSYQNAKDELGELKKINKFTYSKGDEKDFYNALANAKFEKRKCKINCTFSVKNGVTNIETISFEPVYTLAETLKQAGMNTLLGMGTVFCVLILIAFIISLFKIIYNIQNATKEQEVKATIESNKKEIAKVESDTSENFITDDEEIVAVIAAAIASYEGTTTDGLVVRSIRKIR